MDNYVKQPYVPPSLRDVRFYDGRGSGHESELWRQLRQRRDADDDPDTVSRDPTS